VSGKPPVVTIGSPISSAAGEAQCCGGGYFNAFNAPRRAHARHRTRSEPPHHPRRLPIFQASSTIQLIAPWRVGIKDREIQALPHAEVKRVRLAGWWMRASLLSRGVTLIRSPAGTLRRHMHTTCEVGFLSACHPASSPRASQGLAALGTISRVVPDVHPAFIPAL
jgi:hypothetical protein